MAEWGKLQSHVQGAVMVALKGAATLQASLVPAGRTKSVAEGDHRRQIHRRRRSRPRERRRLTLAQPVTKIQA